MALMINRSLIRYSNQYWFHSNSHSLLVIRRSPNPSIVVVNIPLTHVSLTSDSRRNVFVCRKAEPSVDGLIDSVVEGGVGVRLRRVVVVGVIGRLGSLLLGQRRNQCVDVTAGEDFPHLPPGDRLLGLIGHWFRERRYSGAHSAIVGVVVWYKHMINRLVSTLMYLSVNTSLAERNFLNILLRYCIEIFFLWIVRGWNLKLLLTYCLFITAFMRGLVFAEISWRKFWWFRFPYCQPLQKSSIVGVVTRVIGRAVGGHWVRVLFGALFVGSIEERDPVGHTDRVVAWVGLHFGANCVRNCFQDEVIVSNQ